eukprot:CAMPEP_0197241916 /NCGR_PEP_ID=MMETSP1429-20130617/7811_1 /TAXON_ID=49237 /ORGANISM="Chaetoceros  sp., Strain UNC1202" /LENGTH=346 /DNA_ID=CAMNT_0042701833 /DNA_START=122 /DNA_END=1162 /DNA_ORIENTATION=+
MFQKSSKHPITILARTYEQLMAPLADGNLCVTHAMKEWLICTDNKFHIQRDRIRELYDRPPEFFHPTHDIQAVHELMKRLRDDMERQCPSLRSMREENGTMWTDMRIEDDGNERIVPKKDCPALVVSSTSWTPDEDFSILFDALVQLDNTVKEMDSCSHGMTRVFPRVIVIVTGKGPQKSFYEGQIAALDLDHVSILTMWLESSDYPLLLGCADLGVSLHTSTSGLDLPMKVLDMFGCEVPVCAVDFDCLGELVQDGKNGRVFRMSSELADQVFRLLGEDRVVDKDHVRLGKIGGDLAVFRSNIRGMTRWRENWKEQAHAVIMGACPDRSACVDSPKNHLAAKKHD